MRFLFEEGKEIELLLGLKYIRKIVIIPNMEEILQREYGLKPDEKIVVFWTKEINLPHFNRYRVKFRKVFSGKVKELKAWTKKYKIRKK